MNRLTYRPSCTRTMTAAAVSVLVMEPAWNSDPTPQVEGLGVGDAVHDEVGRVAPDVPDRCPGGPVLIGRLAQDGL